MASKYFLDEGKQPSNQIPDYIVIVFDIESGSSFPQSLLFKNYLDSMQEPEQGIGAPSMKMSHSRDRRIPHDIKIETYPTSNLDNTETIVQGASGETTSTKDAMDKGSFTVSSSHLEKAFDKIPFFSGIPSVEVTRGVLHLYKMNSPPDEGLSEMVCALCVPAQQELSAILEALSPVISTISRLRVIRDPTPNQYMLLITFKDKLSANQFLTTYNGRPYNTLEQAEWQLVFVSRVEMLKNTGVASLAYPGLTELPSCSVCLERLDESVLTILCNHSFHMICLTRWEDSTCPICRYLQTPEPCVEDNMCFMCDSKEDLWICLVCGYIGCGRYMGGHARSHFVQTQHTFSMQLGSPQRVWDYIGDNYVHRLVQNKTDGKLVEVSGGINGNEKVDSLQLEYTYLLTSQLESQRLFFEEKLTRVEKDMNEQLTAFESRCRVAIGDKDRIEDKLAEVEREKKSCEKKLGQLQAKLTKVTSQLTEEKELNKCLSENQKLWKDRVQMLEKKLELVVKEKESELGDLKDQVRDLMFYLETQKKVAESPDGQAIQEGHVVVTQGATGGTPGRRSRKKK